MTSTYGDTTGNRADAAKSPATRMSLQVLLPHSVLIEQAHVCRMVVDTTNGSLGIWPLRLDCAAALAPGILMYETDTQGEVYLAVDEGVLVKTGPHVSVAVRNAIAGVDLGRLREAVEREFTQHDARERSVRTTLAKLEIGMVRRFVELNRE